MKNKITEFGKVIRKARIITGDNLDSMAKELGTSASFISAVERGGRTNISDKYVYRVIEFFRRRNYEFDENLFGLAGVVNKTLPIAHLDDRHKSLLAKIANLDKPSLDKIELFVEQLNEPT